MDYRKQKLSNRNSRSFTTTANSTTAPDVVYLRVRRRRTRPYDSYEGQQEKIMIPRSLRLEGLVEGYQTTTTTRNRKKKKNTIDDEEFLSMLKIIDQTNLSGQENYLPNDDGQHVGIVTCNEDCKSPPNRKKRAALWKLVDKNEEISCKNSNITSNVLKRIVTAIVVDDDDDDDDVFDGTQEKSTKRRKLAIVYDTTTDSSLMDLMVDDFEGTKSNQTKNKKKKQQQVFKVLHPLERIVDESLKEVFVGTKTVQQHIQFVLNDINLRDSTGSNDTTNKWFVWCNVEFGNIVHACAIWNDVSALQELLTERLCSSSSFGNKNNDVLQQISMQLDGSKCTPYDVAVLSGHTNVCSVLLSFGMVTSYNSSCTTKKSKDEDSIYEYDLYCLQPAQNDNTENENENNETKSVHGGVPGSIKDANSIGDVVDVDDDDQCITCELRHGQTGYFNENGELVLELFHGDSVGGNVNKNDNDNDDDDDDDDDDTDSNRESHDGNDYPDEDDEFFWPNNVDNNNDDDDGDNNHNRNCNIDHDIDSDNVDDDIDIDDYYRIDQSFRNRIARILPNSRNNIDDYDDDDKSETGLYDASYGIYSNTNDKNHDYDKNNTECYNDEDSDD